MFEKHKCIIVNSSFEGKLELGNGGDSKKIENGNFLATYAANLFRLVVLGNDV